MGEQPKKPEKKESPQPQQPIFANNEEIPKIQHHSSNNLHQFNNPSNQQNNFSIPDGLNFNDITGNLKETNNKGNVPKDVPKSHIENTNNKKPLDPFGQSDDIFSMNNSQPNPKPSSKTPIPEKKSEQNIKNDFADVFSNLDFSTPNQQPPKTEQPKSSKANIDPSCK